jgi:hypothetical protein
MPEQIERPARTPDEMSPYRQPLSPPLSPLGSFGGTFFASLSVAVPAVVVVGIMQVFGEGDYIVAVWTALYVATFLAANHVRRKAAINSLRRSWAFHTAAFSFVLAIMLGGAAVTLLVFD